MPLYDFHCRKCDKEFELLVSLSATPACPECGGTEMQKCVSLTAPKGKTAGILANARAQASKEGHFSNYAASERPRIK